MNITDLNLLSDYNNRVSKGIVHTPEYVARMKKLQAEFDIERTDAKRRTSLMEKEREMI